MKGKIKKVQITVTMREVTVLLEKFNIELRTKWDFFGDFIIILSD